MSCFSGVLGDERQSKGTHERFLRQECVGQQGILLPLLESLEIETAHRMPKKME